MKKLWKDEGGAVVSAELILIITIVVIGLVVGLKEVQAAVIEELNDVAAAIGSVDQSYSWDGPVGCCSFAAGSAFEDLFDECDGEQAGAPDTLDVCGVPADGESP